MANEAQMGEELRSAACEFARLGAVTARRHFGKVSVSRKADNTPVTEADHAAQDVVLTALSRRFPRHAVLTEEVISQPDRHAAVDAADICWVIDPVDGTRNFGRGVQVWSTAVAVLSGGRPLAGAVFDATSGVIYSASAGGGAFRDESRMVMEDRPIDADTTIALSSFRRRPIPTVVRGWMDRYLSRNFGSLCLHMAWAAAGLVDAAYAMECKLWDVAAGGLIIEEAGGTVTDHTGAPMWPVNVASYLGTDLPVLAGTKLMHASLLPELVAGIETT